MKKLLLFLPLICLVSFANAQWIQTRLDSGQINCFAIKGDTIFAGTYGNGVYLSPNNGNSWAKEDTGLSNYYIRAIIKNNDTIYAGTDDCIYMSPNNGKLWNVENNGLPIHAYVDALAISGNNIFAGTWYNGAYLSSNKGQLWTAVNNGFSTRTWVLALAVKGDTIFAGTDSSGAFLSANNGQLWTAINNGLPVNTWVTTFAINGNHIFAGIGGHGVYLSTNKGQLWKAVNNGLPINTWVNALAIKGDTLFAGTYWGGVYMTPNNGNSWSAVNTGLTMNDTNIRSLAIIGDTIFAGIQNSGVWKQSLSQITGIEELNKNNSIVIYPNPSSEKIVVSSGSKTVGNLEILNIQGQLIKTLFVNNNKISIDISTFSSGMYFVRVKNEKGIAMEKFIKE